MRSCVSVIVAPADRSRLRIAILKKGVSSIGGSESHARALARALARRGHAVRVVGLRPPWARAGLPRTDAFEDDGVRVRLVPARFGRLGAALDALAPTELLDVALARAAVGEADVVHCFAREYAGAAERLAREGGAALALTPLVHPGQPFGGASPGDVARYRRADAVCAMTRWEAEWYVARGVARERVHVTGVGPVLEPVPGAPDPATVLFVGRREPYKGYAALARAASLVWRARPDARFVVIGQPAWHAAVTDRALPALRDARWVDLGLADERAKAEAYARCTVLCVPSRHETIGQVYLEAWLARRPVIAGDIPPVREVVDGAGLLVRQDPREVARAVLRLIADPEAADALGRAGYERVTTTYTWDAVAERVERAYLSSLESRSY